MKKTYFLLVLAALLILSTILTSCQSTPKTLPATKPPPTYTGSAPLPITNVQDADNSNNVFVLIVTPGADETRNDSVLNTVTTVADKIRKTDNIFVGVFTMPKDTTLTYPKVLLRFLSHNINGSISPYTFHDKDVTADDIYNEYLDLNWEKKLG